MFQQPYLGIFCVGAVLASDTISLLPSFYVKGEPGKFLNAWGWELLLSGNVIPIAVLLFPGVLATNVEPFWLFPVTVILLFVTRCAFEMGKIGAALAKVKAVSGCPNDPGKN